MARVLKAQETLGVSNSHKSTSTRISAVDIPSMPASDLPSPFGDLAVAISDRELRETAYEILVSACRTAGRSPNSSERSMSSSSSSFSSSPSFQRSLTSTAASKMKKAFGIKSSSSSSSKKSPSKESPSKVISSMRRKKMTVGELVRVQMGESEQSDSRIRRGLVRIAASQLGRRVDLMVLPLELLQKSKASDFQDQQEYDAWKIRNLKVLEAGLLVHPLVPLQKSDAAAQRLRQIIRAASERPLETGKNSESMQLLRDSVTSLACRSSDGYATDTCHWADGFPLNLHLYQMLLEVCFDVGENGSIVEEIEEVLALIKKTWAVLGIDQKLHNLVFLWITFRRFVTTGQMDMDLLVAADNQLGEVLKDARSTKNPAYSKALSSVSSLIMSWSEKRLLAYHDSFNANNIESMECIVSLGVSAAQILVEDISNEYHQRMREEAEVARARIDTYIRSSLRAAFAQLMEKAGSSRHASNNQNTPAPLLAVLAKDIGDLASKEREFYSPVLKKWHPLSAGVAAATLHSCYRNELKQFISGLTELTVDSVRVLRAADKLERDLVNIAVEDSIDSEDGGKALILEMTPFEAESTIADLVKTWIKTRVDRLKEWIDRNFQQEAWNPKANNETIAPSGVDILRIVDETLDAFFQLPILMHPTELPYLLIGLDRSLQYYISKVKSGCGTRNTSIPALPPLTRCGTSSSLWKKKEKSQNVRKKRSQVRAAIEQGSSGLPQLCVRMNTLYHIRTELENLEKKIKTCLRNVESAQADITNGFGNKFELSLAASREGIQQLCESTAYKVIFHDLSHVLWDGLYIGETASSRINPLLKELDPKLEIISITVHGRIRNRVMTALMKASFDGFLLVLLGGGPSRSFTTQDSQILEDDFRALKDLYLADGGGLPEELVEKAASQVRNILPLFRTETESLVDRFKHMIAEAYGSKAESRYPLPPTSWHWSPTEANTILRVLCYRRDDAASKFLKKTYGFPKKL